MTPDQVSQSIHAINQKIAVIETKQKNDHGRIDENKALIKPLIIRKRQIELPLYRRGSIWRLLSGSRMVLLKPAP